MSNNKYLDQYLELYSKWVETRVDLHNYHVRFTNYLGIDSLGRLSVTLKKFPRIEKEMIKMAKLATQEQRAIMKAEKITGKKQAKPRKKFTRQQTDQN